MPFIGTPVRYWGELHAEAGESTARRWRQPQRRAATWGTYSGMMKRVNRIEGWRALVWDPEGKEYIDMLSAYSAVNQGHCRPTIVRTLTQQAQRLTLSSRAFYNSVFGRLAQTVTKMFGCLPMNTGAEAVETGIKLARKWAYEVKGVPASRAIVLSVEGNFHGRTLGVASMSTDPSSRTGFGPFLPLVGPTFTDAAGSQRMIRYDNIQDLEDALELHGKDVAAFLVEPILGEAGIVVPSPSYLPAVRALCTKHNVLLICDEIQAGLGRSGPMLACEEDLGFSLSQKKVAGDQRPDIVLLGKALSGGVYPVSAVLANNDVMLCIQPGEHGSTYGGNPLGCAVALTVLSVLTSKSLPVRAARLGVVFRTAVLALKSPLVSLVRARGLLNAVVVDESKSSKGRTAWQLCLLLKACGVLAKPTHVNIIRFAPPLLIEETDLLRPVEVLGECLRDLDVLDDIPGDDVSEVRHADTVTN
ncbi:pyridoxal phosphate-dependent transferase [Mycena amicta]|nr:pyridoxal phosphate-dependent transferase [Mycena amicta]